MLSEETIKNENLNKEGPIGIYYALRRMYQEPEEIEELVKAAWTPARGKDGITSVEDTNKPE